MSIIKDGKQYNVETKVIVSDEFRDQLFSGTLESVESSVPITQGYRLFQNQKQLQTVDITLNTGEIYRFTEMFSGCSKLKNMPTISGTSAMNYECQNMFKNCLKLVDIKPLPATSLSIYCYQYMFSGCSSLTTAPELPATTLANYCYNYMFYNCTNLLNIPDLTAKSVPSSAYSFMFSGCSKLEKTGRIYAEGSVSNSAMFYNCTSLRETTWMATTPPTIGSNTFDGCPADMIIYVPDASVAAYQAASVWNKRASYIRPMSEKPE